MSRATVLDGRLFFNAETAKKLDVLLRRIRGLHDRPAHGGYFVIASGKTGTPLIVVMLGAPELGKENQYFVNACEKAQRLASHPDHYLSWQSRVQGYKFAGAVRVNAQIWAFSGLPEMLDEALMLALAAKTQQVRHADSLVRAQISSNEELFSKVWSAVEHD
jgi:hypothetical protein